MAIVICIYMDTTEPHNLLCITLCGIIRMASASGKIWNHDNEARPIFYCSDSCVCYC